MLFQVPEYMSKICFLIGVLFLHVDGIGQPEIKVYSGVLDRLGVAFEYAAKNQIGVELGSSYRSKTSSYDFMDGPFSQRSSTLYTNLKIMKYIRKDSVNKGIYLGGYLRYWRYSDEDIKKQKWTSQQRDFFRSENSVIYSGTKKISLGALAGYKLEISPRLTFCSTVGLGLSLPFMYRQKYVYYNNQAEEFKYGSDSYLGYLNHLSFMYTFSFGYIFGKSKSE